MLELALLKAFRACVFKNQVYSCLQMDFKEDFKAC